MMMVCGVMVPLPCGVGALPIEIEAKVRVAAFEPIVARLGEHGAVHVADMLEDNIFFDTPDHALRRGDRGLRLRTIRTSAGGEPAGDHRCVMTCKGPRAPGPMKQREEIELGVAGLDDAVAMLAALGYEPTLRFEKRRTRYRLGDCLVELDELPYLGRFVEIEGPSESSVAAAQRSLGLDGHPPVTDGYATMLHAHASERGLGLDHIGFDDGP